MTRIPLFIMLLIPLVGCEETASISVNDENSAESSSSTSKPTDSTVNAKSAQHKTIVKLTDVAVAKVRELQKQEGKSYLRVAVKRSGPTGFIYDLQFDDQPNVDDDYLDESLGIKILVDRKSALYIEGASIDWQVRGDGRKGFHFDNPNAVQD